MMTIVDKIVQHMLTHGAKCVPDIADDIKANPASVANAMRRLHRAKAVYIADYRMRGSKIVALYAVGSHLDVQRPAAAVLWVRQAKEKA